jgi:hypothetical protein
MGTDKKGDSQAKHLPHLEIFKNSHRPKEKNKIEVYQTLIPEIKITLKRFIPLS